MSTVLRSSKATRVSFIAILLCATAGCDYLPEASFDLAKGSRLPVWFTLSPRLARADVSVTMDYYITSTGRTAVFVLHDKERRVLGKVTGVLRGLSPMSSKEQTLGGSAASSFEVVDVHGVLDVVEHKKMEPVFYMVEDPTLFNSLLQSSSQFVRSGSSSK